MRKRIPHRINDETLIEEKFCKKCEKWRPLGEFNNKEASWDGKETCCSECKKKSSKEFRDKNPAYDKGYQEKNREKLRVYKKEYYHKKKDKVVE